MRRLEQEPRFPEFTGNIVVWARDMIRKLVDTFREVYDIIGRDDEGVWTPEVTAVTNVSTTDTGECFFYRKRGVIHCAGFVTVTPTAGSASTLVAISLPTAPNFTNSRQGRGVAVRGTATLPHIAGVVFSEASSGRVNLSFFNDADTGARGWTFHFMYREIP